jgi:hypothetical protein
MADIKKVYQVAEEMGNSPAMVKKHYFQAVTKAEAGRFWAIRPNRISQRRRRAETFTLMLAVSRLALDRSLDILLRLS